MELSGAFEEIKKEKFSLGGENSLNNSGKTVYQMEIFNRMGILGILSLTVSFYLAFGQTSDGTCDFNDTVSCSSVLNSSYGKLMGVPVAYFGITWNIVFLYIIYKLFQGHKLQHMIAFNYIWNCMSFGFVIYLIVAEYLVGSICPFCTIVHILNVILTYYSFQLFNQLYPPPDTLTVISSLKSLVFGIIILHLTLVIAYNSLKSVEVTTDDFALCLTKHNMVFYGSSKCHVCNNQKQMFLFPDKSPEESPWRHINFVECTESDQCTKNSVKRYPTWIRFTSPDHEETISVHEGLMSLYDLSKMSDCKYINKFNLPSESSL